MPDALTETLKKVRRIELTTRSIVKVANAGAYRSILKGQEMDFDEVREYQPGDEVRTIDWNVTARTGLPHIKKYIEERELTVFLLVDISASKNFGGVDTSKRELAALIAGVFAFSANSNQDKTGLLLFSGQPEFYLAPRTGSTHCLRLIREILHRQPVQPGTDLRSALDRVTSILPRRSLLVIISDFIAPDFLTSLRTAAVRHDIVAVQITDPHEEILPEAGRVRLSDPETGELLTINTSSPQVRNQYALLRGQWQAELETTFRRSGVDHITITTGASSIPALQAFFRRRTRRRA